MTCNEMVFEYINKYDEDEPIFIEDVKKHIREVYKDSDNVFANINVILNRMCKNGIIKSFYKGIYYRPATSVFGETTINKNKVINRKYIKDSDGNIKGYLTGAKLFNVLGLTTQVPNVINIVTNECKNYNEYYNEKLNVVIRQPKIEITNENHRYLQLFDIINNKDNINIEVDNYDEIIYKFIKDNNLEFEKIIKYARLANNRKILDKLFVIAR